MISSALRGKRTGTPIAASERSLTAGTVEDFDAGVVAHQEDDAALGVHAVHVGVANGVGSAVDAGALAVPDAGHAVVGRGSGREIRLASPYRRGGELLVEARDEGDVVLGENLGHAVKHLVDATEGAALVTGDEGGNTLTCPNVANGAARRSRVQLPEHRSATPVPIPTGTDHRGHRAWPGLRPTPVQSSWTTVPSAVHFNYRAFSTTA